MASFPSLPFPTISGRSGPSASGSASTANTISSPPSTTSTNTATASARPPSPSTPSVSGSSIFDTRRAYVATEDTDAVSLRTTITDEDRSESPAPSLNMPRAGGPVRGKRKRLSKACDSCHKSKRRCDGTSPCANCDFAGKPCVYTDANGRVVPPPRTREHEEEHHPTNRPRRHSVSVAHILTHGQHNPEDRNVYVASPILPLAQLDPHHHHHPRLPIPIPGQHHLVPPQPPRPFDTPIPPSPYYYPYYRRPEPESEEELRMRNRRRFESFPPPDPVERGLYPGLNIVSPRANIGRLSGDKGALGIEPHLAKELVYLFFNNQYLASLMLHRPTFMMALSKGQVPMHLLNSIFALAAPYSSQPSLRTSPSWHAGERFAQVANAELFDQAGQLALRPDLAVVQALCLLVLHECVMRRPTTNDRHMCIAFQIMKDLGVATMDDPANVALSSPPTPERDTFEQWASAECHRRTFWVLYVLESLSSAFTSRPMTFKHSQLKVRLPVDEASFELGVRGESAPEYLQFPMLQTKTSSTGEFGHLSWESSLPERLRFNEQTLHNQIEALKNGGSTGGWTYAYMHALAECSILGLHELLEVMPNREAARAHAARQQDALNNLTIILGSLGTRGRLSIWSGTLLLAVVRYRAMLSPQPDPHVTEWCAEFHQQWGVSLAELINPEFRRVWCASVKPKESDSTTVTPPPPSPRSRSPVGYSTMNMPASQVILPPLQSFGLLHHPPGALMHPLPQGVNLHAVPGGMHHPPPGSAGPPSVHPGPSPAHTPLPPRPNSTGPLISGDGIMHPPPDRRMGGMPRGLPWLEDELKNGNGVAPADAKGGPR
ncbi:unnamed protein product [Rhizoctonia solani]|uniref:Zn(2)-C6 fungal-type domain-containing protein n=3 Tax=Rhizoctonia solani TaxID=456999 RepID=A0A8H3DQT4_9AGAM|nr:unnamed protein product [Rhizoctonia solani]CAE6540227.1 unnamed protein product [Rhizoctonia solani]